MLSFHGKQELKDEIIARLEAHYAADEIIQGIGWENGKGCDVGCTLHAYDHSLYPSVLGLPVWLARFSDVIFEGLLPAEAKEFPLARMRAIPVGVDVDSILPVIGVARMERLQKAAPTGGYGYGVDEAISQVVIALRTGVGLVRAREAAAAAAEAAWAEARARAAAEAAWAEAWAAEAAALIEALKAL